VDTVIQLDTYDWISLDCSNCGSSVQVLRLDLELDDSPPIACASCQRTLVDGVKPEGESDSPPEWPTADADDDLPQRPRDESDAAAITPHVSESPRTESSQEPAKLTVAEPEVADEELSETNEHEDRPHHEDRPSDETSYDDETWPDDTWADDEYAGEEDLDDDWSLSSGEDWAMYSGQQDVCEDEIPEIDLERKKKRVRKPKGLRDRIAFWLQERRQQTTGTLVSLAVHVVLMLILGLIVMQLDALRPRTEVLLSFSGDDVSLELAAEADAAQVEIAVSEDAGGLDGAVGVDVMRTLRAGEGVISASSIAIPSAPTGLGAAWGSPAGSGLEGRRTGNRAKLALANGATPESEAAVEAGLKWLARHQREDGAWSFKFHTPDCRNRCQGPGVYESPTGATGLALLCFLGAGYTQLEGEHQETVRKALNWLVLESREGDLRTSADRLEPEGHTGMYAHSLASMALCEAYGMTRDREVYRVASETIQFIARAQHPDNGGWRYRVAEPGDTSVVGWQVMALASARMAGIPIPRYVQGKAVNFLDLVYKPSTGEYGYMSRYGDTSKATTAIGVLCRMYLQADQTPEIHDRSIRRIALRSPRYNNEYENYYITQVLHHWGGERWERWNRMNRQRLVNSQISEGHPEGSWNPDGRWGGTGGRLYMTCMNVLTLEVYYRHLPLYRDESFLFETQEPRPESDTDGE